MKRLILMRHAKSSWSDAALADHDRPLSRRGERDARHVAPYFTQNELAVDLVLCSSALRAQQTWGQLEKYLEPRFGVRVTRDLYMPSREDLVRCLKQAPAQAESVLVVGHNPSLEALALALVRHGDPALRARLMEKFPTAALCVLEFAGKLAVGASAEGLRALEARLVSFVTPADLASGTRVRRNPSKAGDIELDAHPKVAGTALRVFEASAAQLRANAAGARLGQDPEFVHQMRVGVRRLRTALRFFRGVLSEPVEQYFHKELRWLFGLLGPVREYDVLLEKVLAPMNEATGLSALRTRVERQRKVLLGELVSGLKSRRFERLVARLAEQQAELAQRQDSTSSKLKPFARRRLKRQLRKVERLEPVVDALLGRGDGRRPEATALHALRKQLKKLRYSCDFVREAFSKRASRRYLRRLNELQDVLGDLQDNTASERLLAHHLRQLESRKQRVSLRAHIQAPLDAVAIRAANELEDAWDAFKRAEPFWA